MGVHVNVGFDRFPKQGVWLNRRTRVRFNYDTKNFIWGTIVRDDTEEPGLEIIALDDGRFVLSTECQHSPEAAKEDVLDAAEIG
jgi:hypothetical protein